MNYLLIFLASAAFSLNGSAIRLFQTKYKKTKASVYLFQGAFCLIAAILYMLSGAYKTPPAPITIMTGILFGACFMTASSINAYCYEIGPMSITTVISSLSLAIPLGYSCLFLNESISLYGGIGLALFIFTILISAAQSGGSKKSDMPLKWLGGTLLLFILNGTTATIQKLTLLQAGAGQNNIFLAIAYSTAFLLFILKFIHMNKGIKFNIEEQLRKPLRAGVTAVASGIGTFGGNGLLGYLSTLLPAALLYPVQNSAYIIFNSIAAVCFFKEKLTKFKLLAIVSGIGAVIFLSM